MKAACYYGKEDIRVERQAPDLRTQHAFRAGALVAYPAQRTAAGTPMKLDIATRLGRSCSRQDRHGSQNCGHPQSRCLPRVCVDADDLARNVMEQPRIGSDGGANVNRNIDHILWHGLQEPHFSFVVIAACQKVRAADPQDQASEKCPPGHSVRVGHGCLLTRSRHLTGEMNDWGMPASPCGSEMATPLRVLFLTKTLP